MLLVRKGTRFLHGLEYRYGVYGHVLLRYWNI